jgi:sugar lactone lactonase YvrE
MRLGLVALLLFALAAPAASQDPSWPSATAQPAALAPLFPRSATVQRQLLAAAHRAGDAAAVRTGLARLAALGYAPSEQMLTQLAPHLPAAELEALRLRFDANRATVQASRLFVNVPAEHRLVEGIAWDSRTDRLFAATVVGRVLLVRNADGAWRPVPGLDAGSLFGLAVDPRRGGIHHLLWISSGRVEQTPSPDIAFRGLIAVDVDSLRVVRRVAAPEGASPADIAIAGDGTVYASDPVGGGVYHARPGARTLSVLVPPGRFGSPQGLVVAANGLRLYVSDYMRGLAMVTTWNGRITRVESDVDTMLDGIDGLTAWRGGLIAIQNGTNPRRILFLALSRDGRRITRVRVLESNHPEWGEPTLGFIRGDQFLYVADAQWERYGPEGTPLDGEPLRPTAIRFLRP